MSHALPKLVLALTHNFDGWIIGSGADPDVNNPRDYDVVIPHYNWGPAAHLIPIDSKVNSFGGWKCQSEGFEVDVWPGDLGWLFQKHKCIFAWHPASGIRIKKI